MRPARRRLPDALTAPGIPDRCPHPALEVRGAAFPSPIRRDRGSPTRDPVHREGCPSYPSRRCSTPEWSWWLRAGCPRGSVAKGSDVPASDPTGSGPVAPERSVAATHPVRGSVSPTAQGRRPRAGSRTGADLWAAASAAGSAACLAVSSNRLRACRRVFTVELVDQRHPPRFPQSALSTTAGGSCWLWVLVPRWRCRSSHAAEAGLSSCGSPRFPGTNRPVQASY